MQRVLIVEDEPDVADLVTFNLRRAGYQTEVAHDGLLGLQKALADKPDLVLLDLMLPGKDGIAVCKDLRSNRRTMDTPVIILTARSEVEDRIQGLEVGADDYLTKPFSPKELLLRVESLLRRSSSIPAVTESEVGPLRFDKNNLKFYLENEPVDLTATEFKLLLRLSEHAGKPQSRKDLLRRVWGYSDEAHSRTLDTHIKRLRQKLGNRASLVETVRGVGYCVRGVD
tara:strand:+ start:23054 stop:23734 length:681 start_codon:yes stop_codon:yes gene_type:complete